MSRRQEKIKYKRRKQRLVAARDVRRYSHWWQDKFNNIYPETVHSWYGRF